MALEDVIALRGKVRASVKTDRQIIEAAQIRRRANYLLPTKSMRYDATVRQAIKDVMQGREERITADTLRLIVLSGRASGSSQDPINERILEYAQTDLRGLPVSWEVQGPQTGEKMAFNTIGRATMRRAAAEIRRELYDGKLPVIINGMFLNDPVRDLDTCHRYGLDPNELYSNNHGEMWYPTPRALPGFAAAKRLLGNKFTDNSGGDLRLEQRSSWKLWKSKMMRESMTHPSGFTRIEDMHVIYDQEPTIEGRSLVLKTRARRYRWIRAGVFQGDIDLRDSAFGRATGQATYTRAGAYREVAVCLGPTSRLYDPRDGSRDVRRYWFIQQVLQEKNPYFMLDIVNEEFPEAFLLQDGKTNIVDKAKEYDQWGIELRLPDYNVDGKVMTYRPLAGTQEYEYAKKVRKQQPTTAADYFESALFSGELNRGQRRWAHWYAAKCYEQLGNREQARGHAQASLQVPGSAKSDGYARSLLKRTAKA